MDTVLCISLAARPGGFGMAVHNAGYRALGLNYFYKALRTTDLSHALEGVRALGIRGCSLSMPYKETVLTLLDRIDPAAAAIGAVNTVVNDGGCLTGFNTDAHGAVVVLRELGLAPTARILLLGTGGVARAILYALDTLGFESIAIAGRSRERRQAIAGGRYRAVDWTRRNDVDADLVINATPIGMAPRSDRIPVGLARIRAARAVMDVVVSPSETRLLTVARRSGKTIICGADMSLHQAARQFELYTGRGAPLAHMKRAVKAYLA